MVRSLLGSPSVGSVGSPCRHVCAPCRCRVPKQLDAPSSVCSSSPVAPRATVGSGGCSITCRGGARGPGSKSVLRHPRSLDPGRERAPRTQPCSGVHSSSPVIFHLASLPRSHRAVPVLSPVPFPPHAEGRCPPEPGLTCPLLPGSSVPPSREGKGWGSPSAPTSRMGGSGPSYPSPRGWEKGLWSILKAWPLPWDGEVEGQQGAGQEHWRGRGGTARCGAGRRGQQELQPVLCSLVAVLSLISTPLGCCSPLPVPCFGSPSVPSLPLPPKGCRRRLARGAGAAQRPDR